MQTKYAEMLDRISHPPVTFSDPTLFYDDSVLVTRTDARTLVRVPTEAITFASMDTRKDIGWRTTLSLAALREGDLTIRVVHVPVDPAQRARALDRQVKERGTPSPSWGAQLKGQQHRARQTAPTQKRVYLEAGLGGRSIPAQLARRAELAPAVTTREWEKWVAKAAGVRDRLARGSLRGAPVGTDELAWLRRRAVGRVNDVSGPYAAPRRRAWDGSEVASEFADVDVYQGPNYLKICSPTGPDRYVATFVVSTMPTKMLFPSVDPWLAHLDRVPGFTVDVDLVLSLISPQAAAKAMRVRTAVARDQRGEAAKANADLPIEVAEIAALARELEYQIPTRRMPSVSGWCRMRVEADSLQQLRKRFEQLRDHMKEVGSTGIDLAWPGGKAQTDLWAEGVPGSPVRHKSWKQQWLLETVGCALPQAGSTLGHPSGAYYGFTTGQQRNAVYLDLHHAITEREAGDTTAETGGGFGVLGAPRAGKSGAFGALISQKTHERSTVFAIDPPDRLKRLATLPEHAGAIDAFDLSELGGGAVDPLGPAMIPDPTPIEPVADTLEAIRAADGANARALARVRLERETLTMETVSTVAWNLLHGNDSPMGALTVAIRRVSSSGARESSMGALIAELKNSPSSKVQDLGHYLSFYLRSDDDMSSAIAGDASRTSLPLSSTATTRIMSLRSLVLPDGDKPIDQWSPQEQLSAAVFGCGAYLGRRMLLSMDENILKMFLVDEAHVLLPTPSGYRIINELLRHGPKNGIATGLATHNAVDLASAQIRDKISSWFLFRTRSAEEMSVSHAAAGLEDSRANRAIRRDLRNGECIAVLDTGDTDRMQFDQWQPDLARVLNTTSTGRGSTSPAAPVVDPVDAARADLERAYEDEAADLDGALASSGVLSSAGGSSASHEVDDTSVSVAGSPA